MKWGMHLVSIILGLTETQEPSRPCRQFKIHLEKNSSSSNGYVCSRLELDIKLSWRTLTFRTFDPKRGPNNNPLLDQDLLQWHNDTMNTVLTAGAASGQLQHNKMQKKRKLKISCNVYRFFFVFLFFSVAIFVAMFPNYYLSCKNK